MIICPTNLPGVLLLKPERQADARGWFDETWSQPALDAAVGEPVRFVMEAHSHSRRGVLRGLHYQLPPHAQGKLVRVVQGAAFDVALDVRPGSASFGAHVGVELSAHNGHQLWIPPGFAHGFLALTDDTHFLYKTTDVYSRECERSIRWDDPGLAISWPSVAGGPGLAPKDAAAPTLAAAELPVWLPNQG